MNSTGPKLGVAFSALAVFVACVAWSSPEGASGNPDPRPRTASSKSTRTRLVAHAQATPQPGKISETTVPLPIIFVQSPAVADGNLPSRFPRGSHLAKLAPGARSPANLTPDFFASADPVISFDGNQVLFAALQQPKGRWQIWEMEVDGTSRRQLTHCAADCLRPAYLAKGHFVFTAVESDGMSQVHFANLDGSGEHPITFGPGNYQVETVMEDGRILVSADSPLAPQEEGRMLYTLRHDGTNLQSLRCDHRHVVRRGGAAELGDGTVVFVKSKASQLGGELAMIRRGELSNSSLGPEQAISWSPHALTSKKLIVARHTVATGNPVNRFDLYAVDSSTGRGDELIYRDAHLSSVQAVPVAAHAVPRWFWSTVNPEAKSGYFICLDAYHSADAPQGRISTPVAKVRVLTLDAAARTEQMLGDAPVEKDGSFYIAVPPDQPVRFQLLDTQGSVIREQRSWIWSRRGEERGCVGCHEDKAVAPDNRWPLALRRFDTPTPLGTEVDVKAEP